jgi:hypothetical protein
MCQMKMKKKIGRTCIDIGLSRGSGKDVNKELIERK